MCRCLGKGREIYDLNRKNGTRAKETSKNELFTLKLLSDMTNKQRKTMIERWVTRMNPKAILRTADVRCGARYAVCVVENPGELGTKCTDYLPLEQLEQYLLGVFYASEFNRLIGKSQYKSKQNEYGKE